MKILWNENFLINLFFLEFLHLFQLNLVFSLVSSTALVKLFYDKIFELFTFDYCTQIKKVFHKKVVLENFAKFTAGLCFRVNLRIFQNTVFIQLLRWLFVCMLTENDTGNISEFVDKVKFSWRGFTTYL